MPEPSLFGPEFQAQSPLVQPYNDFTEAQQLALAQRLWITVNAGKSPLLRLAPLDEWMRVLTLANPTFTVDPPNKVCRITGGLEVFQLMATEWLLKPAH